MYQLLSRLTSDLGHDVAETGATSEEQPLNTTEPDMGEPEVSQPEPDMGEPEVIEPEPDMGEPEVSQPEPDMGEPEVSQPEVRPTTHQQPPLPVATRITQV